MRHSQLTERTENQSRREARIYSLKGKVSSDVNRVPGQGMCVCVSVSGTEIWSLLKVRENRYFLENEDIITFPWNWICILQTKLLSL